MQPSMEGHLYQKRGKISEQDKGKALHIVVNAVGHQTSLDKVSTDYS